MKLRIWMPLILVATWAGLAAAATPGPAPDVPSKDYAGRPVGDISVPAMSPRGAGAEVLQNLSDIRFDFDSAELRSDQRHTLAQNAEWLKAHPDVHVTIEGDGDERGDIVYNVTLSDHRAIATRDALVELGVPQDQIVFATGWGKLYPVCNDSDESCWSQNRRAHFVRW